MRSIISAIAIAALTACVMPAGAAGLTNEKSQIETLTAANVTEILTELGARDVQSAERNGKTVITFKDGEVGYNAGIICDNLGCTTLYLLLALNTGDKRYSLDDINAANKANFLVQVVQHDQDTIFMSHAMFTDGGVAKKNIAVTIASFVRAVGESYKILTSRIVASNTRGQTSPFQPVSMANRGLPSERIAPEEALRVMESMQGRKELGFRR